MVAQALGRWPLALTGGRFGKVLLEVRFRDRFLLVAVLMPRFLAASSSARLLKARGLSGLELAGAVVGCSLRCFHAHFWGPRVSLRL